MATTWIYRRGEEPGGPVRFRDLVQLVRAESLRADDLVKADWEETWRPAASVVGLFKMAGREDVLARWEAEKAAADEAAALASRQALLSTSNPEADLTDGALAFATADDLDTLLGGSGAAGRPVSGLAHGASAAVRAFPDAGDDALQEEVSALADVSTSDNIGRSHARVIEVNNAAVETSGLSRMWAVIESAVAQAEVKEERAKESRHSAWGNLRRMDFSAVGIGALRWGGALLFANLTAVAILSWSELQSQRFPERPGSLTQTEVFPLWGPCSSGEYAFLLFDATILAGLCGYLAARYIETHAEDALQI